MTESCTRSDGDKWEIYQDKAEQWRVNGGVKMYRRGGAKVSHGLGGSLSR